MVNTGKPSTGCYLCRSRRIKCDEAKPHCMRCQKSKRVCPGYRDAFDLNLRDETKSIKRKASRALHQQNSTLIEEDALDESSVNNVLTLYSGSSTASPDWVHYSSISPTSSRRSFKHSPHSSVSSIASFLDPKRDEFGQDASILQYLTTPIDQQAACFFLSNFVLIPEEGTMRGYLDFVIPLLKKPKPDPSFILAFTAVGFAALGSRPNSKSLLPKADYFYVKALKQINIALQNPKKSTDDATLAAVLLLSVFEQLTASRLNVIGWVSHVDGAVALLKSRGKNQFQTRIGRDLGIAVRAHMTIGCIGNSKPIEFGPDWWMAVEAYDEVTQNFARLNLLTAELRAVNENITTQSSRTPGNVEAVLNLLRKAEALEQRFVEWHESMPPSWEYTTVSWVDIQGGDITSSFHHPGRVDSYGELWMVYTYNTARASRLFVWTTILRCVAWLAHPKDYRITPEYTNAARVCSHLIEDIVASVPCFFGQDGFGDIYLADRSNYACGSNDRSSAKGLSGVFSMWPIFSAAASDFATPSQRTFLKGRLKYIADTMGINQAAVLFNAPLEHPSRYIYRDKMTIPSTSTGCGINPQACMPENPSDSKEATKHIQIPTLHPKLQAPESSREVMEQIPFGPKEAIQQVPFECLKTTVEQTSSKPPEDIWNIRFNQHGSIQPVLFDPPESMEQMSRDSSEASQQSFFDAEEVPIIIPPSGFVPTKMTGWTPRSFEDAASFQDAIKHSPDSEFDFSNFVTV